MRNDIFVCLLEVQRTGPSELIPSDASGAFVRCYVKAKDRDAAIEAAKAKLADDHCSTVAVEWCTAKDELSAELDDDENSEECAREALATGNVVIGRTDIWEED